MKKLLYITILIYSSVGFAQTGTWQQIVTSTTKDLNCIVFPSSQVGYIGGIDSLLLKTTDGGITWNKLAYNGINFFPGGDDFVKLDFINDSIGYATVGPYSGTYRTDDGGLNWTLLNVSMCYNYGLYFYADGEGFVGGSGCFQGEQIEKFSSGTSALAVINSQTLQPLDLIVDFDFIYNTNDSIGLAVSAGGRILRTTDGGLNWDTIPSSLGNLVPLTCVTIVDSNLAYVGYDYGSSGLGLLISTDGGLTWSMDPNTGTFYYPIFHDLHTTSIRKTFIGATTTTLSTGLIMELSNLNILNTYVVDEPINSMTSYNDTVIWGAGKNGYLVRMVSPNITSVNNLNVEETVALFPNPASDFFTIQFSKETKQSDIKIEVYSMDGRLIKKGEPGKNTIQISELTSGSYLVKVIKDSQILQTRLLKI